MQYATKSPGDPEAWLEYLEELPPGFAGYALDCPCPVPDISARTIAALRQRRCQRSLVYFVHTAPGEVRLADLEPEARQESLSQIKRAIHLAHMLGARLVTVHPTPSLGHAVCQDMVMESRLRSSLLALCDYALQWGVVLAIENMPPGASYPLGYCDFSSLWPLLATVAPLGMTLDVGHAHLAQVNLPQVIRRLGQRLRHIHVHDNNGLEDQHLPVGRGMVDWTGLVKTLVDIGYQGFLELEFPGHAAQVAAREYLERLAGLARSRRAN